MDSNNQVTFIERVKEKPRPAFIWIGVFICLILIQAGNLLTFVSHSLWYLPDTNFPALISHETIPNRGYYIPNEGWKNTFLGLAPHNAWLLRVLLIYIYSLLVCYWIWNGYTVYKDYYRSSDWEPIDDVIHRFSSHTWGLFGASVVFFFVVWATFATTLSPTLIEQNIYDPFSYSIDYYDESTGIVQETRIGSANLDSASEGNPANNYGPFSYDEYDRFHPFGTLPSGADLFTFLVHGARISLFIGISATGLGVIIAGSLATVSAYYKNTVDLLSVLVSDSVQVIPRLLLIILLSVVFSDTWLAEIYSGGLLLALIFGLTSWPSLWRAVRGPALQVSEKLWIDAARSFGQSPIRIMWKHMLPDLIGYLLVYASMGLGGIILGVAALSFLGLGITEPTPEWGRAVDMGQPYVATASWHISLIPGISVVLLVTGFNAMGDALRDAIDPEIMESQAISEATSTSGGG